MPPSTTYTYTPSAWNDCGGDARWLAGGAEAAIQVHPVGVTVAALAALLAGRRMAVLTGAGCSTESGIPDYRGHGRPTEVKPVDGRAFVRDPAVRARYWARSFAGWPRVAAARPNAAHLALAELERDGAVIGIVTQNVDGLHRAAGSSRVVELHGALAEVRCLDCGAREPRAAVQARLAAENPAAATNGVATADGDADIQPAAGFRVPTCTACAGVLKPAVVFFGDGVAPEVVARAYDLCDTADALLVVGSSLAVFSGFRFALRAQKRGVPVAIVNRGPTRADAFAAVRVDAAAGEALPALAARWGAGYVGSHGEPRG
jgi:NAD-dependent protein deacetylase/lipoamidase sirtuin 4